MIGQRSGTGRGKYSEQIDQGSDRAKDALEAWTARTTTSTTAVKRRYHGDRPRGFLRPAEPPLAGNILARRRVVSSRAW
jgi:hypothetical protein